MLFAESVANADANRNTSTKAKQHDYNGYIHGCFLYWVHIDHLIVKRPAPLILLNGALFALPMLKELHHKVNHPSFLNIFSVR